jgi:hypothetical protein
MMAEKIQEQLVTFSSFATKPSMTNPNVDLRDQ